MKPELRSSGNSDLNFILLTTVSSMKPELRSSGNLVQHWGFVRFAQSSMKPELRSSGNLMVCSGVILVLPPQ